MNKKVILIGIFLLILPSLALAQEPRKSIEPTESKYGPYSQCVNLYWNGDEYCLWAREENLEYLKTIAPQILSIAESKMLETIPEDYYNEHFDLERVNIKPILQNLNDPDSWTWASAEIIFEYKIGEYTFYRYPGFGYSVGIVNDDGVLNISLNQPREITNVIDKSLVFSEARKCIGTKQVDYMIRENFTILAFGNEPIEAYPYNYFEINLETGRTSCELISVGLLIPGDIGTKQPPHPVSCYDCWQDYIPYIIGVIVIIIIVSVGVIWKRRK